MECQGITQHEVDKKIPKYGKFHETVSYENPWRPYSIQTANIPQNISTFWNTTNQPFIKYNHLREESFQMKTETYLSHIKNM
jgi:hypothetical protein